MRRFFFHDIGEAPVDSLNLEWKNLEVDKLLLDLITTEFKFNKMTPVQAACIPLMLQNKDVIVEAKTGSGKTLAFVIPVIAILMRQDADKPLTTHDVFAIILSPTRELATQIHQDFRKLARNPLLSDGRHITTQLISGGNSVSTDIQKYSKFGANIIVATPGRLSAILENHDNNLCSCIRKKLAILIFDEADQLLSLGFEQNISSILAYLPKQRRTSLFSATQTTEVEELVRSGMRNPIRVNLSRLDSQTNFTDEHDSEIFRKLVMPDRLTNYHHVCDSYAQKLAVVHELIRTDEYKKVLVFFATCSQIEFFSQCFEDLVKEKKTTVLKLHRRLKSKRKAIFNRFKSSKRCILLSTDILSRGIDVPDISCVIHLDLPESPECYVHRSGRSGHQLESEGISIMLLEKHEQDFVELCSRRKIVLNPLNLNHIKSAITNTTARLVADMKQRATKSEIDHVAGLQAFVSYIRFYSSKLCLHELLFPKLPVKDLANSFGLLRLPKMPELRRRREKG